MPTTVGARHHGAMNTRKILIAGSVAFAVALPASAAHAAHSARALADTTVTIKAEGVDLSGKVKSPKQACITDRKVILMKQVGTRGGGDDIKFASDTASSDGSWSTGNTGTPGKFYAKVRRTSLCKKDSSPTVRARR
jgi:hypothetical protein